MTGHVEAAHERPITVEVGLSADDWVRNQTHLRCEERVVLAVQRPGMLSKITITA